MKIGLIGEGAIGLYVSQALKEQNQSIYVRLVRPSRLGGEGHRVCSAYDLPADVDLMVECAGHDGLLKHGPAILERGIDLVSVSPGALADKLFYCALRDAAEKGGSKFHLASGAIGALDCLRAAKVGGLDQVRYSGRKPPSGWMGSPAEHQLDLESLSEAAIHFDGSAKDAAIRYPKNANVAAAVALAGIGFEETRVTLIADPDTQANIHEVQADGVFGSFTFRIEGKALPDNPRSSALAAMSVVAAINQQSATFTI